MTDVDPIARDVLAVATTDDPAVHDSLRAALRDDVVLRGPAGDQLGPAAVLDALASTRGVLAAGTWSERRTGPDETWFSATFASDTGLASADLLVRVDDEGHVREILQRHTPAAPPPPAPVDLQRFAPVIEAAGLQGPTIVVAYVDGDGQPHLSFRGTVQILDAERLAMWNIDAQGGLARAIVANPHLACWYHDADTRTTLQFHGRAHIDNDPLVRDAVFDHSPEREQRKDPDRAGIAIVVDVDRVAGRSPEGAVDMRRVAQQ